MNSLRTPLFLLLSFGCAHAGPAPASEQELTPIGESGFSLAPGGLLIAEGFSMRLPAELRLASQEPGQVSFASPSPDSSIFASIQTSPSAVVTDEECAEIARVSVGELQGGVILGPQVVNDEGHSICLFSGRDAQGAIFHTIAAFGSEKLVIVVCGEAIPTTDYCPTILASVELRESAPALVVR